MYECIINPSSRSGRGKSLWNELKRQLESAGIEYRVHMTGGPGDAIRVARELTADIEGPDKRRLVVLGGDGTLNEVVSGICDHSRVLLGYIPTGSSNDFARGLKLPRNKEALIRSIVAGEKVRTLDVGKLTYNHQTHDFSRLHDDRQESTRHFIVSAGIGFDAAVCEEALSSNTKNFFNRIGLGKLTYGAIALRNLLRADWIGIEVEADGRPLTSLDHFLFAAIMLEPYEGGGFRFAPDAVSDDGLFNLCLIGDMTKPQMFYALPHAYFGRHYGLPGVYHYTAGSIRIRTSIPMWVHTDGEVMMKSDDITLTCLPRALDMMM